MPESATTVDKHCIAFFALLSQLLSPAAVPLHCLVHSDFEPLWNMIHRFSHPFREAGSKAECGCPDKRSSVTIVYAMRAGRIAEHLLMVR